MATPRELDGPRTTPGRSRTGTGRPGPPDRRRPGHRTWPQRLVLAAGSTVTVVCLLGAAVAGYGLWRWYGVDRVDVDVDPTEAGEPMNILLIGSDSREGESAEEQAMVQGKRADTIMVIRIDPQSESAAVLSFPRDLWLPIAGTGEEARINSAYDEPGEQQVLIDTIRDEFRIPINHWIEVDFQGFRRLVDAIGGVDLYFERGLRDDMTGLNIETEGCVTLDGDTALAYARSRQAEYLTEDGWVSDPQSDLSRIVRQQNLMRAALSTALDEASNPLRLRELVDIGTSSVSIDEGLGLGDIRDLAERFEDLDTERFQTASLPVLPRPGDEMATLVVDEAQAEPILNVFRGLDPSEVSPEQVTVSVLNGTQADPDRRREGLAGDATDTLDAIGFETTAPGDAAELHEHTTVRYAPGQHAYGLRVARHIANGVLLEEDPSVDAGTVTLIAGLDFTDVLAEPVPVDELPPPPASAGGSTTTTTVADDGDGGVAPLPTGSTTTTPAQVGAVPPGEC